MSNITFGMVQMALGRGVDMESATDRAECWRMWVTMERELEDERKRQADEEEPCYLDPPQTQEAMNANMRGILGALAGVMAASQAAKPKDEDDGA